MTGVQTCALPICSSSCNPTSIPASTRGVKRSRRKQNVDWRENLDNGPSGSRGATLSSSSIVVRGIKRSRDNSGEGVVDKFGEHQIVKRKRKDGSFLCPFSKCRRKFTREKDLERHFNSLIHLDTLRTRCPAPRCLFKERGMTPCQSTRGSLNMAQMNWRDVRAAHWFAKRPGTRAEENSPLATIIFVRRQLQWDYNE